jgi:hypothetical protein
MTRTEVPSDSDGQLPRSRARRQPPEPVEIRYEPAELTFTGPDTTGQLVALNRLQDIAAIQKAPPPGLIRRFAARLPWPLYLVLAVQVGLSLRLVWANTAFQDEALYLWAGHMEWAHWLDGTQIPDFATYFSGAPVVYPPIGALADSIGGLAGARLLSLAFMLSATCLLWGMTGRLYGRRAAYFAAALFAGLAATQYLGAFATYDAMALFLLALGAWLTVRASGRWSEPLIIAAALVIAIADASKYAATLWDPVIIALAMLTAERGGFLRRCFRGVRMVLYAGLMIAAALHIGGHSYVTGILFTTVSRAAGTNSVIGVLTVSAGWVGAVAFLAVLGAMVIFFDRPDWPGRLTAVVLTLAITLAPADQAHIRTIISLFKHVGFGAWFAAAVGGYALAALTVAVPPGKVVQALRVGAGVTVAAGFIGALLATSHYHTWPNAKPFTAALKPILKESPGPIAASEDTYIIEYYLRESGAEHVFANPGYFSYTDPSTHKRLHGNAAYADAVKTQYFGIIALPFWAEPGTDIAIEKAIARYGGYRLDRYIPYHMGNVVSAYHIWVRGGQQR